MISRIPARIPLHDDIYVLSRIFHEAGFQLVVVGGAVRDFVLAEIDGNFFEPKDIDLATDAEPKDVERILKAAGIVNRGQGEAFGVWIARIEDREYEIATFREDGDYLDGRRPDSVHFCDAESDYKRRDLTMNGLFFEIPNHADEDGEIVDFGTSMEDIRHKRIRTIGKAHDRFREDRLRVLRAVRFHCRFHKVPAHMLFDRELMEAIHEFRELEGVSGERIHQEVMAGISKAQNVPSLFLSYNMLGLLPAIFPDIHKHVNLTLLGNVGAGERRPAVLLASLFWGAKSEEICDGLNKACWPNEVVKEVKFLLDVYEAEVENLAPLAVKLNDKRRENVFAFAPIIDGSDPRKDRRVYEYLGDCEMPKFSGEFITLEFGIVPGPEMGVKQRELQKEAFLKGLDKFEVAP